jgi:hypothetical protein
MKEMDNALAVDWTLLGLQLVLLGALFIGGVLYFRGLCRMLPMVWRSCRGLALVFWLAVVILLPFVGASLARLALAPGTGSKARDGKPQNG